MIRAWLAWLLIDEVREARETAVRAARNEQAALADLREQAGVNEALSAEVRRLRGECTQLRRDLSQTYHRLAQLSDPTRNDESWWHDLVDIWRLPEVES